MITSLALRLMIGTVQSTSSQTSQNDTGMIVLRIKRIVRIGETYANEIQTIPDVDVGRRQPGDLCVK